MDPASLPVENAWRCSEPLAAAQGVGDWDYFGSMAATLRLHLWEHGTVPTWNFQLCGGRPELANPQSWAGAWPSLFAYALPPLPALLAAWVLMAVVGFWALRRLLRGWLGPGPAPTVGALLYVASGQFATKFQGGQASFAFLFLVPVLLLWFDRCYRPERVEAAGWKMLALGVLLGLVFFTGGLPVALFYLYPAVPLFLLLKAGLAAARVGWGSALRSLVAPLGAHLLGAWLAAYKLWPILAWQSDFPRQGVVPEANQLTHLLYGSALAVHGPYTEPLELFLPGAIWPASEYNAFVGPAPWLLALGLAALLLVRRWRRQLPGAALLPTLYGWALVLAGLWLALGNAHPFGLGRLLSFVPVVGSVRALVRYQALVVLGLAILAASGVALAEPWLRRRWGRAPAAVVLAGLVCLPPLAQTAVLVGTWRVVPLAAVRAVYPPAPSSGVPHLISQYSGFLDGFDAYPEVMAHQQALLERGGWVANCYDVLSLQRLQLPRDTWVPVAIPEPEAVRIVAHDAIELRLPVSQGSCMGLNLPPWDHYRLDPPAQRREDGALCFEGGLPRTLRVEAQLSSTRQGLLLSLAGLLASLCLVGAARWRGG